MISKYNNYTIVFFGDSITDSGKNHNPNHPDGSGFVNMIKSEIEVYYQDVKINIINEGISGNKTEDLIDRFDEAVKIHNPNIVFLLIGINDIWHLYDKGEIPNITAIIDRIDMIINKIKNIQSDVVILTPFLFPTDEYFENLMPYFNELINNLYDYLIKNNLTYINLYKILKENQNLPPTKDSVHPTIYGHAIIAQSIINFLNK